MCSITFVDLYSAKSAYKSIVSLMVSVNVKHHVYLLTQHVKSFLRSFIVLM